MVVGPGGKRRTQRHEVCFVASSRSYHFSKLCIRTLGPATAKFVPNTRTKSGSTNLPEGTVHVFRESATAPSNEELEASASSDTTGSECVMLGVLAVPAWMTPSDFLSFVAPAAEGMAHLRIIR